MRRMVLILAVVGFSVGACAVLPPTQKAYPPQQTTVSLSLSPDAAYQRAYTVFAKQPGWVITGAEAPLRTFRGVVHNAAELVVLVEAQPPGSLITIHGHILPNKLVKGEFTEVQGLAVLLKEPR